MNNTQQVNSLSDYINVISSNRDDCDGNVIYRGQANSNWDLSPSATRRLKKNYGHEPTIYQLKVYHKSLVENILMRGFWNKDESTCLDIVTKLQHYGAATGLLDFSCDAFVALYFACNDKFESDGCVYYIEIDSSENIGLFRDLAFSELKTMDIGQIYSIIKKDYNRIFLTTNKPKYIIFKPTIKNNRVISQKSVFLFGMVNIEDSVYKKIIIKAKKKKVILEELRTLLNIQETTIYNDFEGYALGNGPEKELDAIISSKGLKSINSSFDYIFLGKKLYIEGDYQGAINNFEISAYLIPENSAAYTFLGKTKYKLKQLDEALDAFSTAIDYAPKSNGNYISRGLVLIELNKDVEALQDFNKACNINPNNTISLICKGYSYMRIEKYNSAIETFTLIIKEEENIFAYLFRSICYKQLKCIQKEKMDYEKAKELDEDFVILFNDEETIFEQMNLMDKTLPSIY